MAPWHLIVAALAGWINREQQAVVEYLKEENRILREHLGPGRPPFTDAQRRRLAARAKALGRKALSDLGCIVTPDTLLRWYRQLIATKYDGSAKRRPGRPRTRGEIRDLVVKLARENPTWGYTRIRDTMSGLGHVIGRTTVQSILKEHGLEPAPERRRKTTWKAFLKAHWGAVAACDFFTVEVATPFGLTRYYVFFVLDLATRRVELGGIIEQPHGGWMLQVARNLTDAEDGFLTGIKFLIMDRDPLYTRQFRDLLAGSGVIPVRLPARSPNLNAYAERFVLSIKSECLDRLVLLGEKHLRTALREYLAHYHAERPHQGLAGQLIEPAQNDNADGPILCRERLGGILRHYHRNAA